MSKFFNEAAKLILPQLALLHISDGLYLKRITIKQKNSDLIDTIIEKTYHCVATDHYCVTDYKGGAICSRYKEIFSIKSLNDGMSFSSIRRIVSFPKYALEDCLKDVDKFQLLEHNVNYYWLNLHITVTVISLRIHNV